MMLKSLFYLVSLPNIYQWICSSSVAIALVISCHTCKACLLINSKYSILFLAIPPIPVAEVFNSSCPEIIFLTFFSKANIKNLIRPSSVMINQFSRINTPYLNIMIVTFIDSYKIFFIWWYCASSNCSSFFCKFNSLNFLTSSRIPNKNNRSLSLLSWNSVSFVSTSINFEASNIVCMSIKIIHNLFTHIINFPNSKKGLSILVFV